MNTQKKTPYIQKKAQAAIRNTFIADALAMPVHWYYRVADIYKAFPDGVNKFVAAPANHPSSIMNLHSTNHGGRKGSAKANKQIVGEVILKGKARYWNQANVHYHHGMPAGENTLNAYTVLWLLQSIINNGGAYDEAEFLQLYINNMTANSPQHPDTYAESYHRGFFANYAAGKSPNACGAVTHDTASVGGLVRIGPFALLLLHQGRDVDEVKKLSTEHLLLTHPDENLKRVCSRYVDLIAALYHNDDVDAVERILYEAFKTNTSLKIQPEQVSRLADEYVVGQVYSTACYISDSWPAVLYLALKYHRDPKAALISNVNVGGDNVHRGSVLGFILGVANPVDLGDTYGVLLNQKRINQSVEQLFSINQTN
ncbi:ADP-ribosylglycohydrolase family protein [Marinicella sp. S1101]|uniref:ADP-ribosylglycohydrolase family protein n=1 Tax=Marinicella marina TaxID=2996016 RepID=UPI002260844D|nr:ADP-ribosylglycohydrolase family protein [Marinicella marina]MCX7554500.1 ADP-ribosylglycohydrolase family protein [Marinicella marina]MDJ1140651.1 ADP-ribosylglycohydrolase family protein [Marinicella marina]